MKLSSLLVALVLFYPPGLTGWRGLPQAEAPLPTPEVVRRFAKAETDNKIERINYQFTLDYKLVQLDPAGAEIGEFIRVSEIKLDDSGKPSFEKIIYQPPSTLPGVIVTNEDIQDSLGIQPFALTEDELPKYQIDYLGREQLAELSTYKFGVKPKRLLPNERYLEGQIWVEAHDLQIVKVAGLAVPETGGQKFPRFETYREKVGRHWFPVYTYADDVLRFKNSPHAHVRMTIRYSSYKRLVGKPRVLGDCDGCESEPAVEEVQQGASDGQGEAAALEKAYQLQDVVRRLTSEKRYKEAIPNAERMVAIYVNAYGSAHLTVAAALEELAGLYRAAGDYARTEQLLKRILEIKEGALGRDHPDLARPLGKLIDFYYERERPDKAEPYLARALPMFEKAGEAAYRNPEVSLTPLGGVYLSREESEKLEQFYLRAVAFREKTKDTEALELVDPLRSLARLYITRADYAKAEAALRRALSILEKEGDRETLRAAGCTNDLGALLYAKGEYAEAEGLLLRAVAMLEKGPNPRETDLTPVLNNLGLVYYSKGDYAQAERQFQRAVAITKRAFGGKKNDTLGLLLNQLGMLYFANGNFKKGEPLLLRAAENLESNRDAHNPDLAQLYSNLGTLYFLEGDYVESERRHRLALELKEEVVGAEHPDLAPILTNLATLYWVKGDYANAERQLQRGLSILGKALRPDHPSVGLMLIQLGLLYISKEEPEKAEQALRRAAEILKLGDARRDLGWALTALAVLYISENQNDKAELQLLRAQAALKDSEPEGISLLSVPVILSNIDFAKGDYAGAEAKLERSRAILEKELGPNNPFVVSVLHSLAVVSEARGDIGWAVKLLSRAGDISEQNIARNIVAGSERQKLRYLSTLSDELDHTVSLHVRAAPDDPRALHLALTTLLTRKGRTLDVMTDMVGTLRRFAPQDGELAGLLDALTDARSRYATLLFEGAGDLPPEQYRAEAELLANQVEKFEAELSERSPEFRAQSQRVTLEAVIDEIPRDAALVEFLYYYPFDAKKGEWDAPRYVAYILKPAGEPYWVDLGSADEIDAGIKDFRVQLRTPNSELRARARALDELLMRPVRARLGKVRRLFISPDAALNLIPFAALLDEKNRYLIESYSITYLTSGRDLLRLKNPLPSRQGAVVITAPDFDSHVNLGGDDAQAGLNADGSRRSREFQERFSSLSKFAAEGAEVAKLLQDARVLPGERATEAEVKKLRGPRVLHMITHGFFQRKEKGKVKGPLEMPLSGLPSPWALTLNENPLLRSGLALAGANVPPRRGSNDGILTALETAGLDLWGTKLVTLSACETGVGAVENGEGVYGLRRALVLAGAESQVMSLWRVNDQATQELMIEYYRRLAAGKGRGEALRQVQLEILGDERYRHPYFWAGFIQSGDWRSLSGEEPPPPADKLHSAGRRTKAQTR